MLCYNSKLKKGTVLLAHDCSHQHIIYNIHIYVCVYIYIYGKQEGEVANWQSQFFIRNT